MGDYEYRHPLSIFSIFYPFLSINHHHFILVTDTTLIAGIDLGTTFSLVAYLQADGKPALANDAHFKQHTDTPSAVILGKETALVGYAAELSLEQQPNAHIFRHFKRDIGTTTPFAYDPSGNEWYAEALSALVLKKLRNDFENTTSQLLDKAVITIPAHFNDRQRRATQFAAAMADVPLLGLVEEPVAAALHYGIQHESAREQLLFVYDFGGGTFDATVMTLSDKGIFVLSKDGHSELGGVDVDKTLMNFIAQHIEKAVGQSFNWTPLALLQLRREAEAVKIGLAQPNNIFFKKRLLIGEFSGDILFNRQHFERGITNTIEKSIEISRRCIAEAGLTPKDIDCFLLVGGSSMMPCIAPALAQGLSIAPTKIKQHEPLQAVAYGAALFAAQLSGQAIQYDLPAEFRGVSGYHLGIRTFNVQQNAASIDTVIRKNTPLPIKATRQYYTHQATQSYLRIELVQFLETPQDAFSIGFVDIGPIQQPRLNYVVEVVLEYLPDGTVAIRAFDPQTGAEIARNFDNRFDDALTQPLLKQKEFVRKTLIN